MPSETLNPNLKVQAGHPKPQAPTLLSGSLEEAGAEDVKLEEGKVMEEPVEQETPWKILRIQI